jgi:hypothetical protein
MRRPPALAHRPRHPPSHPICNVAYSTALKRYQQYQAKEQRKLSMFARDWASNVRLYGASSNYGASEAPGGSLAETPVPPGGGPGRR